MKGLFFIAFAAVMVYVYSQEVPVNCPDPKDGNATLVAHPCDCTSYFVCFADGVIPMPCPPGLHFNRTVHTCDWPWRAGCRIDERCPRLAEKLELAEEQAYV
ncbi:peritrophin-1-like [Megachile rotundata]|uniref:peritrophin-1-like n=1 Tax=Megachile rotundata TaxID=143995 RepID=UPI003FD5EF14